MRDPYADIADFEAVPDDRLPVAPGTGGVDSSYGGGGQGTGKPLRVNISPDGDDPYADIADPFDDSAYGPDAVKPADVPASEPATWGGSLQNAVAAVGQGLAGIPDAATNALGAVMGEGARYGAKAIGAGADALGFDGESIRQAGEAAATKFYNPITIGGLIEKAAPTPPDATGKGVRLAGQLGAGFMTIPGVTPLANSIPKAMGLQAPKPLLNRVTAAQEVSEAAEGLSEFTGQPMRVLPADMGGQTIKTLTEYARKTPFGQRVNEAASLAANDAGAARDFAATSTGAVKGLEAAGETAVAGADKYIKGSSRQAGKLYDEAEKLAGDARVSPKKALDELDRNISELAETPGGADGIAELTKLRDSLAKGDFTISGIRRMRSILGQKYLDDGLRMGDLQRRVNRVIDAAGDDVTDSLVGSGKSDAASAYKAADAAWKARVETIDRYISPIIGKDGFKSGEDVIKALEKAADGNGRRFQKFIEALPPEEAGAVRASIIKRIGQTKPSGQDAAGDVFSFETFLTRWNTMTPRAKVVLFDKPTREAMGNLAKIASGARMTRQFANSSNSGTNIQAGLAIGSVGSAAASAATGNLAPAFILAAPAAAQAITARMVTSPRFLNWLGRFSKIPANAKPGVIKSHLAQLTAIATRDPAAADITAFQKMLQGANDNAARTGSAAASPDERPNQE